MRVMDQRRQKDGVRGSAPGGVRGGADPPPPYPIKITASNITESGWSPAGVIRVTPLPKKDISNIAGSWWSPHQNKIANTTSSVQSPGGGLGSEPHRQKILKHNGVRAKPRRDLGLEPQTRKKYSNITGSRWSPGTGLETLTKKYSQI